MQPDSGLAFVVIQHLSPDFRSMMDELLNRHSEMKIRRVEAGMVVEPNTIYLNPARADMEISNGRFSITPLDSRHTLHLPINVFMTSLAREQGDRAIAIILSGTGSDGTVGAAAIQGGGGTVLVQEPETAKFDGMPTSVIDALKPDAVASPALLAGLVYRLAHGEAIGGPILDDEETEPKDRVFQMLRDRFGTDFSHYKNATIERRLNRRAELLGFGELSEYVRKLATDDEEAEALYADFLIEVTEFFRDQSAFEALNKTVIPDLIASMSAEKQVRVWVPGCASGEEAYSIAIGLAEEARRIKAEPNIKLLATDIHHRSLEAANFGVYDAAAVKKIPEDILKRYFEKSGNNYQIRPFLRQMVVFSVHNILRDPPFTKIDLVSCRNLLIYLNDTAQQKALAYFHFSLVKGGHLFLGPSETVGELSSEFELIDQKWRLFVKRRNVRLIESMTELPRNGQKRKAHAAPPIVSVGGEAAITRGDAKRVYDRSLDLILKKFAPPGFLLRRTGEVIRVFGDAGRFVEVGEGNFSQRVDDLVRGDLRVVVTAALDRAKTPQSLPFERRVTHRSANSTQTQVTVVLEAINDERTDTDLLLLTINEESRSVAIPDLNELHIDDEDIETVNLLRQRIEDIEHELKGSEETLQSTVEELETSNEELQATNEELMASNEELQSTNEELHSVNEELYTVSAEHQRKIIELTEMSGDMEHLLQATGIGTIFVDSDLRVRRFTTAAVQAFNILNQDIGRPISHITNRFGESELTSKLGQILATGESFEQEVELGDSVMLLRALPYIASPDEVSGAVITMVDVTELKRAQTDAQQLATRYEGIVQDIGHFMLRWGAKDQKITFCNDAYLDLVRRPREQVLGRTLSAMIPSEKNEAFISLVNQLKPGEASSFLLNVAEAEERPIWYEGVVRAIDDGHGAIYEYQALGVDITESTAYRIALEKLSKLSFDTDMLLADSIHAALEIGLEFFDMPLAIFSRIEDQAYHIESVVGGEMFGLKAGATLDLKATFCSGLGDGTKALTIPHISNSDFNDTEAHRGTGLEAYIGQRVKVGSHRYGSLSFSSRKRKEPFSPLGSGLIATLADWIGSRVERDALMEGIAHTRGDLDLILDNIRAKVWYKDDKNRILRLNKSAAESMGLTLEAATGADTYDLFPEMAAKYHKDDLQVIESGEPLLGIVEEFVPKDAPRAWVSTDKIPYLDHESNENNLLVISLDITHQKEQEQQVVDLYEELTLKNDRLLTSNDSLRQFAHVASHDLQEPLRKLMQFTEYLIDDCGESLSEDGAFFLDVISSSAERMRTLVQDILSLSGATGKDMVVEEVDLPAIVRDLQTQLEVSIEESGATFEIGVLPKVQGDATLVEQLFKNLLSNALKYRNADVAPHVAVACLSKKGGGFDITVSDNGIGMSDEDAERIFEPFTRLHDRKTFDGTGIGLAICRTVCDRHGWQIRAKGVSGEGTTFTVKIPAQQRVLE